VTDTHTTARERLRNVISFTECCNNQTTPEALIAEYRNQVLTEAAELIESRRNAVHAAVGRQTADGMGRAAALLRAARTTTAQEQPHSCSNCDGIDPTSCLMNRTTTAQEN
jgi:hypothetical protein